MADHGKLVLLWSPPMDVAVATAHWAKARTQISARDIQQRFAECGSSCLVANQRREDIALFQKQTARHAHRFLAFPNVDAAGDQAAPIETNEFFLQRSRQEHPAKRFEEALVWQRCLWLFGFRLALRRLKHPAILRKIGQPAQKNFTAPLFALQGGQGADNSKRAACLPRRKTTAWQARDVVVSASVLRSQTFRRRPGVARSTSSLPACSRRALPSLRRTARRPWQWCVY